MCRIVEKKKVLKGFPDMITDKTQFWALWEMPIFVLLSVKKGNYSCMCALFKINKNPNLATNVLTLKEQ